jgi:hypothetical protein
MKAMNIDAPLEQTDNCITEVQSLEEIKDILKSDAKNLDRKKEIVNGNDQRKVEIYTKVK